MAKWLKDYLSFGSRRVPPQPPTPDYTESEILRAYRLQKNMDFEDPYEDAENRSRCDPGPPDTPSTPVYGSPMKCSNLDMKSPKHRLIKVDSQDLGRTKILLSAISLEDQQEPVRVLSSLFSLPLSLWGSNVTWQSSQRYRETSLQWFPLSLRDHLSASLSFIDPHLCWQVISP